MCLHRFIVFRLAIKMGAMEKLSGPKAKQISSTCLGCASPRCEEACPLRNPIRECLSLIRSGEPGRAAELLYSSNPFPELTSALCEHFCKQRCIKGFAGSPIDFGSVEGYLASFDDNRAKQPENGRRIAIIGAGPAGLSCAYELLLRGFSVEVFDSQDGIGGAIREFIPRFRFDDGTLKRIYGRLTGLGCRFHLGSPVDLSKPLEGFEATFAAVGANEPNLANFVLSDKVVDGLSFLKAAKWGSPRYPDGLPAYVYGGGNVAFDAARTLARLGAKAKVIYRRGEQQMPGNAAEYRRCLEDGVEFMFQRSIVSAGDRLLVCHTALGEKGKDGRASFSPIPGSEEEIPYGLLVLCIGQRRPTCGAGLICIGDAKGGASDIPHAIASGLNAGNGYI